MGTIQLLFLLSFISYINSITIVDPDPDDTLLGRTINGEVIRTQGQTPCGVDIDYIPTVETGCQRSYALKRQFSVIKDKVIYRQNFNGKEAFLAVEPLNYLEELIARQTKLITKDGIIDYLNTSKVDCPVRNQELLSVPKPAPYQEATNETLKVLSAQYTELANKAGENNSTNITIGEDENTDTEITYDGSSETQETIPTLGGDTLCNLETYICYNDKYLGPPGECIWTEGLDREIIYISDSELAYLIGVIQYRTGVSNGMVGIDFKSVYTGFSILKDYQSINTGHQLSTKRRRKKRFFGFLIALILEAIALGIAIQGLKELKAAISGADAALKVSDKFYKKSAVSINTLQLQTVSQIERRKSSTKARRQLLEQSPYFDFLAGHLTSTNLRAEKLTHALVKMTNYLYTTTVEKICDRELTTEELDNGYLNIIGSWLRGIFCIYVLTTDPETTELPDAVVGKKKYYNGHFIVNVTNPMLDRHMCGIIADDFPSNLNGLDFDSVLKIATNPRWVHSAFCKSSTYEVDYIPHIATPSPITDPKTPEAKVDLFEALCAYCVGAGPNIPGLLLDILEAPFKLPGLFFKVLNYALGIVTDAILGILSFLLGWKSLLFLIFTIIQAVVCVSFAIFGAKKMLSVK